MSFSGQFYSMPEMQMFLCLAQHQLSLVEEMPLTIQPSCVELAAVCKNCGFT